MMLHSVDWNVVCTHNNISHGFSVGFVNLGISRKSHTRCGEIDAKIIPSSIWFHAIYMPDGVYYGATLQCIEG